MEYEPVQPLLTPTPAAPTRPTENMANAAVVGAKLGNKIDARRDAKAKDAAEDAKKATKPAEKKGGGFLSKVASKLHVDDLL